jgi:septal ring factor EnvC (AmiA/AmiB activator)
MTKISATIDELKRHLVRLNQKCAELEQKLEGTAQALIPTWSARKAIKSLISDTFNRDARGLIIAKSGNASRRAELIAQLDEINFNPEIQALIREHRILEQTVSRWKTEIKRVQNAIAQAVKKPPPANDEQPGLF